MMRRALLGVFLLWACSGQNTVAGEEKTKAEQLGAALPSWCKTICNGLAACPGQNECNCSGDTCDCTGTVNDECPAQCEAEMSRWTTGSDECALLGQGFKKCIEDSGCDVIGAQGACSVSEAEDALCPYASDYDGGSSGPPEEVDVPSEGYAGSLSYAGSASYGGTASAGGSSAIGPGAPPVYCLGSEGDGPSSPMEGAHIICEEGWGGCSDGHEHRVVCATGSDNRSFCSCFLDTEVTGAFDPGGICPSLVQVNTGCVWNIAD